MWRPHSPERVAAEVALLVDEYDAWTILLADDNFAASSDRVMEICRRLCKGPLPAAFFASIRADDLVRDPQMATAMAEARILRVTVGVETLEPQAAAHAGKPIDREVYREAFALLRANGIFSLASFITGLPGQQADVDAAVEQAVSAGPDAAVFVPFLPMPGTPLAEGRTAFEPNTRDRKNAEKSTAAFFQHPAVRKNLAEAESAGGIRGLMAKSIRIRSS
jgi:anaerobic magnesium-protoporphyrin IX monomethyl ester cyclase